MRKRITSKKTAEQLIKKHDVGKNWSCRHDYTSCACNSGNSGWCDTYNNGEKDIFCIEYLNNHEKAMVFSLVEEDIDDKAKAG
ncbi:MAG: hypothetical protein WC455_09360 [Dehalococcoidia bacterium]|jgi:hypothetical protein